jgi:hypothetical protein
LHSNAFKRELIIMLQIVSLKLIEMPEKKAINTVAISM